MAAAAPEAPRPRGSAEDDPTVGDLATFAVEYEEDNRTMRLALVAAVVFHLVLLAISFPEIYKVQATAPARAQKVYVVQQLRFRPPPPQQQQMQMPEKAKRIPIPDPTPDEPEPIREIRQEDVQLDLPEGDAVFGIPEGPPGFDLGGGEGPVMVGGDVLPPVKVSATEPLYTEDARKARIQGVVIVQAVIDKDGNVRNVKVLKGLPSGLDQSAVDAIKQWKFKPSTRNGEPVAVYYNLTVNFRLQ